jgi:hypothetical protein
LIVWIIIALVVVLGVPFTLWWWRDADKWADAEHRRFKPKPTPPEERIVVPQDRGNDHPAS